MDVQDFRLVVASCIFFLSSSVAFEGSRFSNNSRDPYHHVAIRLT